MSLGHTHKNSETVRPAKGRILRVIMTAPVAATVALTSLAAAPAAQAADRPAAQMKICTSGDATVSFTVSGVNQNGTLLTAPPLTLHSGQCNNLPNGPWWWSVGNRIQLRWASSRHGSGIDDVHLPADAAGGTATVTKNFLNF